LRFDFKNLRTEGRRRRGIGLSGLSHHGIIMALSIISFFEDRKFLRAFEDFTTPWISIRCGSN
jgi:hypothetical protein